MRTIVALLLCSILLASDMEVQAQNQPSAADLYRQVATGKTTIESLTPEQREQVLSIARMMRPGCDSNSRKCQAVCDASRQLEETSRDLAQCASNRDFSDDCDAAFNDVRDAHDEYEQAVDDADGDCR